MSDTDTAGRQPPPGYDVGESNNDTSIFSCPHDGCNGMTFYTVEQCIRHESDWHDEPYACACGERFAARPALQRHVRSAFHRESEPENYSCLEECCPKYKHDLGTLRKLEVHNNSRAHQAAEYRNNYFGEIQHIVSRALEDRVIAFRHFRCDVPTCPEYGHVYSAAPSFLKHVKTDLHQEYDADWKKAMTSGPSHMGNQSQEGWEFQCLEERCEEYKQRFRTNIAFRDHCASASHVSAAHETPQLPQTPERQTKRDVADTGLLSPPDSGPKNFQDNDLDMLSDLPDIPDTDSDMVIDLTDDE